jgi:hypothetical protein
VKRRPGPPSPREVLRAWPLAAIGVLALGLALAGPVLIVVGLQVRERAQPITGGIRTQGRVVSVSSSSFRGRTSYTARVSFRTVAGQAVTFTGTSVDHYPALGSLVPVSYAPKDPQDTHELRGNHQDLTSFVIGGLLTASDVLIGAALLSPPPEPQGIGARSHSLRAALLR